MSKTTQQQQPVELNEEELEQSVGGARSPVKSITVTFDTQASGTGDPDQPLVLGSVPTPGK